MTYQRLPGYTACRAVLVESDKSLLASNKKRASAYYLVSKNRTQNYIFERAKNLKIPDLTHRSGPVDLEGGFAHTTIPITRIRPRSALIVSGKVAKRTKKIMGTY